MGAIESRLERALRAGVATAPASTSSGRLSWRRLDRALAYMHAHLHERVRLDDIAYAAGLSAYHFSRAFRKTTGVPPYRYLLNCRVERVRELLRIGDRTLADIAADTGFADQSHMCNVFRRLNGTTPGGFRDAMTGSMLDK